MVQRGTHQNFLGKNTVCLGLLACVVFCGVMAAGCSALTENTALPSFEEKISITIGEGQVRANFASYPINLENKGVFSVPDVCLQADLVDVTGGDETVIASQEVDAGSLEPGEVRTVTVEFRLIKLTGKNVDLRVIRIE